MTDTSPEAVARLVAEMRGAVVEFARFHSCAHTFGERCVVCTGNAVCDTIQALARERDDAQHIVRVYEPLVFKLQEQIDAQRSEREAIVRDLKPLHDLGDNAPLSDAWGTNICAWAAGKIVALQEQRDALLAALRDMIAGLNEEADSIVRAWEGRKPMHPDAVNHLHAYRTIAERSYYKRAIALSTEPREP